MVRSCLRMAVVASRRIDRPKHQEVTVSAQRACGRRRSLCRRPRRRQAGAEGCAARPLRLGILTASRVWSGLVCCSGVERSSRTRGPATAGPGLAALRPWMAAGPCALGVAHLPQVCPDGRGRPSLPSFRNAKGCRGVATRSRAGPCFGAQEIICNNGPGTKD